MNASTKYFFNRSFEILYRNSFDSYRLSLNNPFIIFDELNTVALKYSKNKVKNFKPTVSDLGNEAFDFLKSPFLNNLLLFETFSQTQITDLLDNTCVKTINDAKIRSIRLISRTIIKNNSDFKGTLIERVKFLLTEDKNSNYLELDTLTGWLHSQLIFNGFSKYYIANSFHKCADSIFKKGVSIDVGFDRLNSIFNNDCSSYMVYFKIKVNAVYKLQFSTNKIEQIDKLPDLVLDSNYVKGKLKDLSADEVHMQVTVNSFDFWSAIASAQQLLTESIDINVLHHSTNKITIENQAIALHVDSGNFRINTVEQEVDGFYHHNETEFNRFVYNLKNIRSKSDTAKEKISSAIRFYKLGNESIEMEHKILNYWIGFEQLFSAIDSNENSIIRMKVFYTSLNISYYFQRKVNYLISCLKRNNILYDGKEIDASIFLGQFDKTKITGSNPIYIKRLEDYFKFNNTKEIKKYIESHTKRLNQHLTRIYRVRNELVHEGKTKMNVRLMAGHLRHYLLFTIEQMTNEISENPTIEKIDDVFVYFENLMERIKLCKNLNEIIELKNYNGYME